MVYGYEQLWYETSVVPDDVRWLLLADFYLLLQLSRRPLDDTPPLDARHVLNARPIASSHAGATFTIAMAFGS